MTCQMSRAEEVTAALARIHPGTEHLGLSDEQLQSREHKKELVWANFEQLRAEPVAEGVNPCFRVNTSEGDERCDASASSSRTLKRAAQTYLSDSSPSTSRPRSSTGRAFC